MNKLVVSCSIRPVGARGFLIPSSRKNPRFAAGTTFYVKEFTSDTLFVKFSDCNSIFAISHRDANKILGMNISEYKDLLVEKRSEGIRALAKALVELKNNGELK